MFRFLLIFFVLTAHLFAKVPENRRDVHSLGEWLTWAFFGNDDDGLYGEKPTAGQWTKEKIGPKRAVLWWMRNPMHNLLFYVVGSADRPNSEFVLLQLAKEECAFWEYREKARTVFAGKSTSFFLGLHGWKPFISLRLDYGRLLDVYVGWRERGNFGIKCVLAGKRRDCDNGPHGTKKIPDCCHRSGTGGLCRCHPSCPCRKKRCTD